MIDNRDQVERRLGKLTESLPLSELVTPALMTTLCERSSTTKITLEGGVMCPRRIRRGRRHARSGVARLTLSPSLARSVQKDSEETMVNPPKVTKARCSAVMTARRSDCGRSPRYHAVTSDPQARPKLKEIC